ncbi:MAG: glycosyltransferase family 4 protein [Arcanobacterium sp.]|nr:glycosyltransferase family 4 protein [Arcanobacterium sp.]
MMKKILIVTTWLPTQKNKTSGIFVERDIAALSTIADVSVLHLVAPNLNDGIKRFKIGKAQVERFEMNPKNPLHILKAVQKIQKLQTKVDLIHTIAVSASIPMAFINLKRPWIHTEHWSGFISPDNESLHKKLIKKIIAVNLKRTRTTITVSKLLAEKINSYAQINTRVVPNIVDFPEKISPQSERNTRIKIIGVGGMIPGKNPKLAIEICAELQRRGLKLEFIWLGDGPLLSEMKNLAAEKLEHYSLPGSVSPEKVSSELATSDIFLVPTKGETFFLGAAEALAHGCPVVTGALGGHTDFVKPPYSECVQDESIISYANAVERVLATTTGVTRAEIGKFVRENYSKSAFISRMEQIYKEIS